jgi:hypothetical protein
MTGALADVSNLVGTRRDAGRGSARRVDLSLVGATADVTY